MAKDRSKIISGAGTLWIGDTTSDMPTIDASGNVSFDTTGDTWESFGFTEGVTVEYSTEFQEIFADGHLAPVKLLLSKEGAKIATKLHQRDIDNFNRVIAASQLQTTEADSTSPGTAFLAVGDGEAVEKQLYFIGKNSNGLPRAWNFPVVVSTGAFKFEGTNESVPLEVEFTAVCNPESEAGTRLFNVYELTALPTN